ncbi:MAG: TadE/TadG family type IV pilus assembly protein [Novosphingobium sp.]
MSPLSTIRRLLRSTSGLAMTEFALGAPFLLMAGLWGTETANFALVNMKVGQLAVHVADNASRIGDTSTLRNRQIFEEDINDLLLGANLQGGKALDLYEHGRVIITSVEVWDQSRHNSTARSDGVQFAHWQRCKGALVVGSEFASENRALPNGIGPVGEEVQASVETPVIAVEVFYRYQPLISDQFIGDTTIRSFAIFAVRDDRDLEDVFKRNSSTPIADCRTYDAFPPT